MPDLTKIAESMRVAVGQRYRSPLMRMHELEAAMLLAEQAQAAASAATDNHQQ